MSRVLAIVALSAAVGAGIAAPVPKEFKDDTIDLRKFHDRITAAVRGKTWVDADTRDAEKIVAELLKRMAKAAELDERKSPVEWAELTTAPTGKLVPPVLNTLLVCENVVTTKVKDSVIIASDAVRFADITNCIVIAKRIRCEQATNSVLIAHEAIDVKWVVGKAGRESVVVAGEQIGAKTVSGSLMMVVRPTAGKLRADDRMKAGTGAPITMTDGYGIRILGIKTLPAFADEESKAIPLKAPIAK